MFSISSRISLRLSAALIFLLSAAAALAAKPPAPQPDPDTPNIFYGAIPPGGNQAPLLVFVHGLGSNAMYWWTSNDDMYTAVYNAGYRSAFMSLSPDNSANSSGIAKNSIMLKSVLPKIAAHFQVSNFYVVGHSKGGVDMQAALLKSHYTELDTNISKFVLAVFTLATPNTGTELANWAFGNGKPIAQQLGLLTPGLLDLQTSFMATFRTGSDPVFATAGIPFYTTAGTKYTNNPLLLITGTVLQSLTPGEDNDGLVPEPRTKLPTTYGTALGDFPDNHFEMGHGSVSFPTIQAQIQALEAARLAAH